MGVYIRLNKFKNVSNAAIEIKLYTINLGMPVFLLLRNKKIDAAPKIIFTNITK